MSVFFKTKLMSTHMSGHNNNVITTVDQKHLEPFRVSDGVMRIGKYRKKKLSELPWYLRWSKGNGFKPYKGINDKRSIMKFIIRLYSREVF